MLTYFAAQDPQTVLSSGNTLAILALIIVTLAGVVIYLARKIDKQATDSAAEIKELNKLLFAEGKSHTADYKEMAKDNQEVLQGNSQSIQLMAGKIEAVKGQR
jgi:metal-responsive CopG/Arc/MetJ family transcriptional regulator